MAGRKLVEQCTLSEWRAAIRQIRASIPPPAGYAWRFVWSARLAEEGLDGRCDRTEPTGGKSGMVTIRVAKGLSLSGTADTLIHEMAHAFDAWTHHGWAGDHSDTWGVWYARIYRRYWGLECG